VNSILTTPTFDRWLADLKDVVGRARIVARIDRAENGHFGDCGPIGEGVSEMRIHIGPGYRVYFIRKGQELYVLLAGGDKSTQATDIKHAQEIARQL
jgi:putative addiction module killer protein